jgi:energy-coupling factor transporter ATP-binding protein EcfA2
VAVARALVTEPALILADEPTGNLDSTSTTEVLDLLAALHRTGRTIVLITHEHDVAARAERTISMRDGRVVDAVVRQPGPVGSTRWAGVTRSPLRCKRSGPTGSAPRSRCSASSSASRR